jgi:hypothetical protein
MSVSVIAVPTVFAIELAQIAGAAILSSAVQAAAKSAESKRWAQYANELNEASYRDATHIQINEIIEKEFETSYMDKNLLLKTLEEHGLADIEEDYDGTISGSIENFTLSF